MRICVYGAGSIGGNFATRLAAAGNDVSIVVRGAHLEAIRANGLTLLTGDKKNLDRTDLFWHFPGYLGAGPGFVAGVFQLNFTVPVNSPSNPAAPVVLTIGGRSSAATATMAIQ